MNTNTLKMVFTGIQDRAGSEPVDLLSIAKAKMKGVMSSLGVLASFMVLAMWMNQPLRVELASWLIPAEAYKLFENGFETIPSVAPQAAKIPTSLVDTEAVDPKILKSGAERQAVASYISNKYKIAHSASLDFVDKAMVVSREVGLDPTLILAVTAVESSFNPLAESKKGAQGLMQVMTRVHVEKFQLFGGHEAALDPDANMRVGSLILREYIAKGGSLHAGLRLYVGASSIFINDGGYGTKVLAERDRLRQAAALRVASLGKSL
jgi:soluble lytic murein transglycosylase-like protein